MSLLDNLVAHYKLNDNADSTVVEDEKGNNGASVRNTSLMHTAGKVGGALNFNGTSDYINTNANFMNTFRDDFSISFWCKPNDGMVEIPPVFLSTLIPTDTIVEVFYTGEGKVFFQYIGKSFEILISSENPVFTNGQQDWHFIAVMAEQINLTQIKVSLYFDNVFLGSTTDNYVMSDSHIKEGDTFFIGGPPGAGLSFAGSLDNVMIFNKALTADEILTLWNGGNGTEDLSGGISMDFFGQDDDEWNS